MGEISNRLAKHLPPERYPLYFRVIFVIYVLLLPVALASSARIFRDGDVSWHIAAGRWIIEHRTVPDFDPFSFTMAGQPWVAHEWLPEIIYAAMFDGAGYAGLAAVVATSLLLLHLIIFLFLRNRVGPIAMFVAFIAMDLILLPPLFARPHVLVWPLVAAWTAALLHYRDKGRAPPILLALLMLLWVNLHGSFPLGFVIAGLIGLDAMIDAQWSKEPFLGWLRFGLLSAAFTLMNANGLNALIHPFTILGMEELARISEWLPSTTTSSAVFFSILLVTLALLLRRGRALKWGELTLLLVMLGMALHQIRHQSLLAIVAILIVTPFLADRPPETPEKKPRLAGVFPYVAGAAAVVLLAIRALVPIKPVEGLANPHTLITSIPSELREKPVLNEYSMGGPLILHGVRPFIDGRADMYGDKFYGNYLRVVDGDDIVLREILDRYDIQWTIFPPKHDIIEHLDSLPEWRRGYENRTGIVHIRR